MHCPKPNLHAALLVLASLLPASPALAGKLARYEPATGCYIGAYIQLDQNIDGKIKRFEQLTGKKHATYFRYVGYGQPFPYKWVKKLHREGAVAHIAWEPNGGLSQVQDDDYLHGWAQAAARTGVPIFLRYASEMNGNWMAYSGDPDLYIAKWRLVYRVMHQEAPNVVMIWCPFATPRATIPLYYPGDDYVDWVGVNIYSVLHLDGDPTQPASQDPRELLRYVYDMFAYRKPIAICEYAATHYSLATKTEAVDFAIDNMTKLYTSLPTQFPRVRMINWFSVDTVKNGLAENDYSVTDNPQVLATYRKLIASDYFLSNVVSTPPQLAVKPTEPTPAAPAPVKPAPPAIPVSTSIPLMGTSPGDVDADSMSLVLEGGQPAAVSGRIEFLAEVGKDVREDTVTLYVDNHFAAITNVSPYCFTWDADRVKPGEHIIKAVAANYNDQTLASTEAAIVVVASPAPKS